MSKRFHFDGHLITDTFTGKTVDISKLPRPKEFEQKYKNLEASVADEGSKAILMDILCYGEVPR